MTIWKNSLKAVIELECTADKGYLKIKNENDRISVATILFKNGYTVRPVRFKKNGRANEYCVKYEKLSVDEEETV